MTAGTSANISPVCEQKSHLPEKISGTGDVYLPSSKAGRPAALHVTITSLLQASLTSGAERMHGYALSIAEERKIEQYYRKCSEMSIHVMPLALETVGGRPETMIKTMKRLAILADNIGMQHSGSSIASNRL